MPTLYFIITVTVLLTFVGCQNEDPANLPPEQVFAQSCQAKDAMACNNLGLLYQRGLHVSKDLKRANEFLERSCSLGAPIGCHNLAINLTHARGIPKDIKQANTLFQAACTTKLARSCTNLGISHARGRGLPIDHAKAAALYKQGCDGGSAIGCTNLGMAHERGQGVKKQPVLANTLFDKACQLKDMEGCNNLAFNLLAANPKRYSKRAIDLLKMACDQHHIKACHNLGILYFKIKGDVDKARTVFTKACKGQHEDACSVLRRLPK